MVCVSVLCCLFFTSLCCCVLMFVVVSVVRVGGVVVGLPLLDPLRRTAQNVALFFLPLPPQFLFFSPSLVGLLVEF